YYIASQLDEPIPMDKDASEDDIKKTFDQIAFYPEEYKYWNWNEELNVMVFFQKKIERPVYYNQNGVVLLFLNEDNEVTFYLQTMLGETESLAEKRTLIEPMR